MGDKVHESEATSKKDFGFSEIVVLIIGVIVLLSVGFEMGSRVGRVESYMKKDSKVSQNYDQARVEFLGCDSAVSLNITEFEYLGGDLVRLVSTDGTEYITSIERCDLIKTE